MDGFAKAAISPIAGKGGGSFGGFSPARFWDYEFCGYIHLHKIIIHFLPPHQLLGHGRVTSDLPEPCLGCAATFVHSEKIASDSDA